MARREHSRLELQGKLISAGFPAEIVIGVLNRLQSEGLQSDERFTEAFVSSRLGKGQGVLRVRADLRTRGVEEHLIAHYLERADEGWRERLESVRQKRFGSELPQDPRERARQVRFLLYRGFSSEQIHKVFKQNDWD